MTASSAMDELTRAPEGEVRATRLPVDVAPSEPLIDLVPAPYEAVAAMSSALDIHPLAAQTLVRRGFADPEAAAAHLRGGDIVDPAELPGAKAAAAVIAAHVRLGTRIAVHGDYDVDGTSSTAILVRALAGAGADVTWHVPSRFADGYGLSLRAVEKLADDGAGLIVTVDCGIGSVTETARARELGVDVVICDHHTIPSDLPEAPIVHPGLGGYPSPFLCAAATTHKLAQMTLRELGADEGAVDDDLALVALATVCDVVPLEGENRALVRAGIERMRRTLRPGLRELMRVAGVDQLRIGAEQFGFALGPRINAAGRMQSAEAAVELFLTSSETRAAELADHLNAANLRRREVEQQVMIDAERQAAEQRDQYALVVAGEDWHPGVLGIVAGKLAERYRRPAVVLGLAGGVAAGSGRSGGVFDLHAGLAACSERLIRFGGHRAAAGVELDEAELPAFRREFAAVAASELSVDDLRPRHRVDAVADPSDITLDAIASLESLGPFGAANPDPVVLLPAVALVGVRKLGERGQHFKLTLAGSASRADVVAFNQDRAIQLGDEGRLVDAVVELGRNEYRGVVEPQAILRGFFEHAAEASDPWDAEFVAGFETRSFAAGPGAGIDESRCVNRIGAAAFDALLELAEEATPRAAVVNDPARWQLRLTALATTNPRVSEIDLRAYDDASLAAAGYTKVLLLEPPPAPAFAGFGEAEVVLAWDSVAAAAALNAVDGLLLTRPQMVAAFRAIRDSKPENALAALREATSSGRVAGRALRALEELELVSVQRNADQIVRIDAISSDGTALDRSPTFRSYSEYREQSEQWLRSLNTRTQR